MISMALFVHPVLCIASFPLPPSGLFKGGVANFGLQSTGARCIFFPFREPSTLVPNQNSFLAVLPLWTPPAQNKVTIIGKNENLVGPFFYTDFWVPDPPPPLIQASLLSSILPDGHPSCNLSKTLFGRWLALLVDW